MQDSNGIANDDHLSEAAYPLIPVTITGVAGEMASVLFDVREPVSMLRNKLAMQIDSLPTHINLVLGDHLLSNDETLAQNGIDEDTPLPVNIVLTRTGTTSVGAFTCFAEEHIRITRSDAPGQIGSSIATKIGSNRHVSFAAMADRIMEPDTGTWWWSLSIVRTQQNIIMFGVCSSDADPNQSGLRFTQYGCAYECWNGLFYAIDDTNRQPIQLGWGNCGEGDVLTFSLDTHCGEFTMYRNGQKLGILPGKLKGRSLRAHVELEFPGDSVELFEETAPLES